MPGLAIVLFLLILFILCLLSIIVTKPKYLKIINYCYMILILFIITVGLFSIIGGIR